MKKCNHPNCVDGVMHEAIFPGVIELKKCEYCIHDEQSIEDYLKEIRGKKAALNLITSEVAYGN